MYIFIEILKKSTTEPSMYLLPLLPVLLLSITLVDNVTAEKFSLGPATTTNSFSFIFFQFLVISFGLGRVFQNNCTFQILFSILPLSLAITGLPLVRRKWLANRRWLYTCIGLIMVSRWLHTYIVLIMIKRWLHTCIVLIMITSPSTQRGEAIAVYCKKNTIFMEHTVWRRSETFAKYQHFEIGSRSRTLTQNTKKCGWKYYLL